MLKLHLGCGKRDFGPTWHHIDGGHFPHVKSHNVKKLPFKDNTVDVIYCSHLICYFDRQEIMEVLFEWNRVLKKGGTLRIATPDFWKMVSMYPNKIKLPQILGPLYGRMDMGTKKIYHKTTYDFIELKTILTMAGFNNVKRYDHTKTDHAEFDDHSAAYLNNELISLNVECNAI
jgi:predicted SAM-dependent methyltransferase